MQINKKKYLKNYSNEKKYIFNATDCFKTEKDKN